MTCCINPLWCRSVSFMFASLSSLLPSSLLQVSQPARPPDVLSTPPASPTDVPALDIPRKKEKKEKHPNEVRPLSLSLSPAHPSTRPSSSSALPHHCPHNHSASKSSSYPPILVRIDPSKHSTLLPMTSTLISSAPTQTDPSHPTTPAIPRPPPSLLSHPPPLLVHVVA